MARRDMPTCIPATELRPGYTVWREDTKQFVRDVYLADYFLGGWEIPPSNNPADIIRRLEFTTASEQIVKWHPCGMVFVTPGKDDRKIIPVRKARYNG